MRTANQWRVWALSAAMAAAGAVSGCAGRSEVTTGPDQARNLPPRPHYSPQQYPSPSQLPAAHEPTPATQQQRDHHPGAVTKSAATKSAATTQAATQPLPNVPAPDPAAAQVPQGFKVEVVMHGLTYPTSAEFDDDGNLYVAEAGYSYGDSSAKPRILRVSSSGEVSTVAADGLEGPINDLLWHQGRIYIAHRGKISALRDGGLHDLVTGLPSAGDHHTNQMSVGPDGRIYFGQGTATNSGVVGVDNFKMGWLKKHPDFHDVPAKDLSLIGRTFETPNPLRQTQEQLKTSAYHPFAKAAPGGGKVHGQTKGSGTILRMTAEGSDLEVYAWGLRNPFGVMWSPDGTLYATENGFDVRGSRPVANDQEDIYVIEEGAWYGWPDFAMGLPVTEARFKPQDKPQPQFLMADHPPVRKPWMNFPKHAAITKLDFARSETFGAGRIFVAFFGHMTPMTGEPPQEHGGHRVVAIDPKTKQVETFLTKKNHGGQGDAAGHSGEEQGSADQGHHQSQADSGSGHHAGGSEDESVSAGPRRLVDVCFAPDGRALYVVDFGSMIVQDGPRPIPETGVIWRITSEDADISTPPAGLTAPK